MKGPCVWKILKLAPCSLSMTLADFDYIFTVNMGKKVLQHKAIFKKMVEI